LNCGDTRDLTDGGDVGGAFVFRVDLQTFRGPIAGGVIAPWMRDRRERIRIAFSIIALRVRCAVGADAVATL